MSRSPKDADEWDSNPHNLELKKHFGEDVVEAVKEVDLDDKETYDRIDVTVEKIRRARERLCAAVLGKPC